MALSSVFKQPEASVVTGLAEAAAVVAIYQMSLPNVTDVRTAQPNDRDVEAARKRAAWKAAGILGIVFLLTQDLNSLLIGGATLSAIDLHYKHANGVHPSTGKLSGPEPVQTSVEDFAVPDYSDAGTEASY